MSIYFSWLHRFQDCKYPKNIRIALNKKYKSLHRHEKTIKNIMKHSGCFTIFGHTFKYDNIAPLDLIRIKRHKYMINKISKEINNIKNHYDGLNK